MSVRYVYRKLTGPQFKAAMDETGLGGEILARLLGTDRRKIQRWGKGEDDIPHHVTVIMAALTVPEARALMLQVTDEMIEGLTEKAEQQLDDFIARKAAGLR